MSFFASNTFPVSSSGSFTNKIKVFFDILEPILAPISFNLSSNSLFLNPVKTIVLLYKGFDWSMVWLWLWFWFWLWFWKTQIKFKSFYFILKCPMILVLGMLPFTGARATVDRSSVVSQEDSIRATSAKAATQRTWGTRGGCRERYKTCSLNGIYSYCYSSIFNYFKIVIL